MRKPIIIITGGAGFIGSCLVSGLNARDKKHIIIVDSLGQSDKWKNLAGKSFIDYIDKNSFLEKIRTNYFSGSGIHYIVHLGACSKTTEKNADYMIQNNTIYTRELAIFALKNKIPFYYASSAATYGDGSQGYDDDESGLLKLNPLNLYGFSKHLFDIWALSKGWLDKITGFKFFNVFGPNESHKTGMTSAVFNAFHQIRAHGNVKLFRSNKPEYRDGEQKRDFIYVKDVVSLMLWFFENPHPKGIYNIGCGVASSWNYITECVFEAMGLKPDIAYVDMPEILKDKYQYHTCASVKKLKQICPVSFSCIKDGVYDYIQNYLQKGKTL